jgi:hypothetical protein
VEGIQAAASLELPSGKSELFFYHKEGHYMRLVSTPLMCQVPMDVVGALVDACSQLQSTMST